jgi:hypothetical protein
MPRPATGGRLRAFSVSDPLLPAISAGWSTVSVTVTVDMILTALNYRKRLSGPHADLIEALVAVYPGKLTAQELQGHVSADIGVVLGNIGRRLIAVGVLDRKATGKRPSRSIITNEPDPKIGAATYQASEALVTAWQRFKGGKN